MVRIKYKIYTLSARAVLSYAKERNDGIYSILLNSTATEKCRVYSALHEQEDNALFFQSMCVLHGNDFQIPSEQNLITDLSDIIFYMDFAEIFDRDPKQKRYADRQKKAESMFRPEGVTLDFGTGPHRYLAFERSGNMSRNARLSFIREDFYAPVRQRIMLDMKIGMCQLSKLYAYNGLMLSGGVRIDGVDIDRPHRVIVVANNEFQRTANVITVEENGGTESMRKYKRVKKNETFTVREFDGEGIIAKGYARTIDKAYCGKHIHTSFQIRMPYVKGMLHEVDFKDFLHEYGTKKITDIWGVRHPVEDVDIILTKSMFKGYGWLIENRITWDDYWDAFRRYRHALYITNVSKEKPQKFTELNYQFLNTVSMKAEEFRPADLPDGWTESPESDSRNWLTKQTETEYYRLCADNEYRRQHFLSALSLRGTDKNSRPYLLGQILKKNPSFIGESVYADELDELAEKVCRNYSMGILRIAGDNRFLSGDLLRFLTLLIDPDIRKMNTAQRRHYAALSALTFKGNSFYAPKAAYEQPKTCTLLRSPHIARNEEILLHSYGKEEMTRKYYLGHLSDVVMVDSVMFAAERLGGADYDGDMIKTISDPVLNACVQRNYNFGTQLDDMNNMPFLKIPAAEPRVCDANDWHARFETVKNTFSSRVGQISNAALDRSIIAYNENSDAAERERCREETETLAILTGLEIDSAKSGVKPDLSEYLGQSDFKRNLFLKYKYLTEKSDGRSAWYEPTPREKLETFIQSTDWSKVDSNLERLPYLAYKLKACTPKIKAKPAPDSELFSFAADPAWKDSLDPSLFSLTENIIREYHSCLNRIRISKAPIKNRQKKNDIERILFSRGQEESYTADELYAAFSVLEPEHISQLRNMLREQEWHMMDAGERESFLCDNLPEEILADYGRLLCDFRFGGYRILGDLICDIDDENTNEERKRLTREGDSALMSVMIEAYQTKTLEESYREAVAKSCRRYLEQYISPSLAVRYAAALDKREFIWDVLLDKVAENVRVPEVRRD